MTSFLTDFTDAETLAAAVLSVLAAPKTNGPVCLLCTRAKPNQRNFPESLILTRALGVVGKFEASRPWLVREDGSPDPRMQVSLMSARVLDQRAFR